MKRRVSRQGSWGFHDEIGLLSVSKYAVSFCRCAGYEGGEDVQFPCVRATFLFVDCMSAPDLTARANSAARWSVVRALKI